MHTSVSLLHLLVSEQQTELRLHHVSWAHGKPAAIHLQLAHQFVPPSLSELMFV